MHRSGDRRSGGGRKRSLSEDQLSEIYGGPTEFMEAGARGFLVTTLPKKEEFAIDDATDLLRQTAIKLYGGYKPSAKNSKQLERKGYVKVDCLNLESVKIHPHPNGEEEEVADANEAEMQEAKAGAEKQDETTDKSGGKDETPEDMDADEKGTEMEESKEGGGEEKEGGGVEKAGEDEKKEESESKPKEEKKKDENQREKDRKREEARKESERRKDAAIPRMHSIYNFKAYRTEMRNVMFIKSDVPDPMEVARAAMELVLERKSVTGDSVCQLLPVLGVCQYDYHQLEIMCRRTLTTVFDEAQEPKSFAVMLIDKLSEPGSEGVYETVRNTVWSVNPLAWLSSSITEPDVVLRFELIGSKLVLSCLQSYMSFRQYSPTLLVDLGKGDPEDDDGGWMSEEAKKQLAQKRLERERQREQERLKEEERQKERAKKQEEAEARRKAREEERKKREEERKERREKEKKEKEEKDKTSRKADKTEEKPDEAELSKKAEKSGEDGSDCGEGVDEDTPPSKKQKTEEEASGDVESAVEETPPPKRQRVDSNADEISKEEEELLLAEDPKGEQEKEADDEEETQKTTPSPKRTTRGTRGTKKARGGKK